MDKIKNIQKNIFLASYTTFKIGGPAKYFYYAKNTKDLIKIIKIAKIKKVPFFILGCGSNILVSDEGFNGLVIKIQNFNQRLITSWVTKFKIQEYNSKFKIICDSGVLLCKLIRETSKLGASGLEWFVGIPGTISGAIYGNAGWSKNEKNIGDLVKNVIVLRNNLQIKISQKQCKFNYRDSIFKHNNDVILSAELQLQKKDPLEIKRKTREILAIRKKNCLYGNSAGCIFKNIPCKKIDKKLFKKYSELKNFDNNFIPAGYLIDQCGLKGKKIGEAMVSKNHANFIINTGQAQAKDVIILISLIKQKVRDKFNIQLQEEIQYVGF